MSLWGNLDAANNAPKFGPTGGLGLTANTQALFGNTTVATTRTTVGVLDKLLEYLELMLQNKHLRRLQTLENHNMLVG